VRYLFKRIHRFLKSTYFFLRCAKRLGGYKGRPTINNFCVFTKNTFLGINAHFNGTRIEGKGRVTIGNNFHSGSEVLIITSNHNYEGSMLPYDETEIHKCVTIGDNVWIGSRVIILGGVTIGDGAIVQAGSVVINDIGYCEIAGGAPAKPFKKRDITHYERLKNENKYF